MAKGFWYRLFWESKEEKQQRLYEEREQRLEKQRKKNREKDIENAQKKLREIVNRKEELKSKTSFTTFKEFHKQYGYRWEEIVKGGVIPQDEMNAVCKRIEYLMKNNDKFVEEYGRWTSRGAQKKETGISRVVRKEQPQSVKSKTSFNTFDEFYKQYGYKWEEERKTGVSPRFSSVAEAEAYAEEMKKVTKRLEYLLHNDENFRTEYEKWNDRINRQALFQRQTERVRQRRPSVEDRIRKGEAIRVYADQKKEAIKTQTQPLNANQAKIDEQVRLAVRGLDDTDGNLLNKTVKRTRGKIIEVPDFKSAKDFSRWVDKLGEAEIQSWTTKDWNTMYAKLDKVAMRGTNVEKYMVKDALIKLNRNYRMEEADFQRVIEIGRKVGKNLSASEMNFDLAGVNVDNDLLEETRRKFAENADKEVWKTSVFSDSKSSLSNYDISGSKVSVVDEKEMQGVMGTSGKMNDYSAEVKISNSVEKDVYGATSVHESVHGLLQGRIEQQREVLAKLGVSPNEGLSEDFYKLMRYNDKYYVSDASDSTLFRNLRRRLEKGEITENEFNKLMNQEVFRGHLSQPLEKQAQLIGLSAEHTFRMETGQVSERTARSFVKLSGKPMTAKYSDKGAIDLVYQVKSKEAFEKQINAFLDDEMRAKLSMSYDEKQRLYKVTVPSDMDLKNKLEAKIELQQAEKTATSAVATNGVEQVASKDVQTITEKTAARRATRAAIRAQTKAAMNGATSVGKKAVQSAGSAVLKANAAYDALFDKNVKILMDMNAPQWMRKVDNAVMKTVDNKVTHYTAAQLQKWGEEFVKTPAGKKIQQKVVASYAKMGGDAMAKSAAKKIPLVCVGIACAMAKERFENGEYIKGGLEVVSGVAACVPVFGTAVSLGIDAGVLASDLYESGFFSHGAMQADANSHMVAESTGYDNRIKSMNEAIERQNREAKSKKVVRRAAQKKAAEQTQKALNGIKNMAEWRI